MLAAPQGVEAEVLGERDRLPDLLRRVASLDVVPTRTVSSGQVEGLRKGRGARYPGVSSKRGRSSVISCQGAFDATKM